MSEPKWIKCSNGHYACVDEDDYERLAKYSWEVTPNGYVRREERIRTSCGKPKRVKIYMHRDVLSSVKKRQVVDHINMEKLDNRKSNLRIATYSENNCHKKNKSKTGYVGVQCTSRNEEGDKYCCTVQANGLNYFIYGFTDPLSAAIKRNELAKFVQGEFAVLSEVSQC